MNWLKKVFAVFMCAMPFAGTAMAVPFVVGAIGGAGVIAGFSIYRSMSPVNMSDALSFFSTCWTCDIFSSVMSTMSTILPRVYSAIGIAILPIMAFLCTVWFAWRLVDGFINTKIEDPWSIASFGSTLFIKLAVVVALLMAPLPRILGDGIITPVFNIGLTLNHAIASDDGFARCMVATAANDATSVSESAMTHGAYSPNLRHSLTCELANVHQMTGLGMAAGWTMLNMAFNAKYMHKLFLGIPIFPNVPIFMAGLLVLVLFFIALVPVPLYFLEVFIKLSMDLIMLPLMLMSWLFSGWKVMPNGKKNIQTIINDVVSGTLGIAAVGVFVTFSVMFMNAVFGAWGGANRLSVAIDQNDSAILLDGLMMRNDSFITILMMGIFISMFMIMTVSLAKTYLNITISQDFYNTAKKNFDVVRNNLKKWYDAIKK